MAALFASISSCSTSDNDEDTPVNTDTGTSTPWNGSMRYGIESATLDDDCVNIVWADTARVEIASNIFGKVSAQIRDGHVTLLANENLDTEVTYVMSGISTRGSLYMDGNYKSTIVMNGIALTNPDSAAVNIRDGKRIAIYLAEGTTNTLADGSNLSHKACMMIKGHTEFSGAGTLNLYGYTGHAFWGKEYLQLKATTGTINIKKAVGDGINVNQYFQMNGGTLNIEGTGGDGLQVSYKTDDNDNIIPLTEDADNTSELLIKGGTLTISTTAADSKCLKTEGEININENKGTTIITLNNSGSSSGNSGMNGMGGGPGRQGQNSGTTTSASSTASKGIKADGNINIEAGSINVTTSSHEGIESKSAINITGGNIYIKAYDDAINSAGNITINGGTVYAYSSSNDGIDSNGNMNIGGGNIIAFGANGAESGLDIDEQHSLSITSGTLFSIGGRIDTRFGSMSQAYGYTSQSATYNGNYIAVMQGSTPLWAVRIPTSSYNGIALVSSPKFQSGTSYTLASTSAVSGTETCGFIASPTVGSSTSKASFTARK